MLSFPEVWAVKNVIKILVFVNKYDTLPLITDAQSSSLFRFSDSLNNRIFFVGPIIDPLLIYPVHQYSIPAPDSSSAIPLRVARWCLLPIGPGPGRSWLLLTTNSMCRVVAVLLLQSLIVLPKFRPHPESK